MILLRLQAVSIQSWLQQKKMEARFEIFEWICLNCHNFQSFHARMIGRSSKEKSFEAL